MSAVEHPMSDGQKVKCWKLVKGERVPCRAEDLRVKDIFVYDGNDDRWIVGENPVRDADGTWVVHKCVKVPDDITCDALEVTEITE